MKTESLEGLIDGLRQRNLTDEELLHARASHFRSTAGIQASRKVAQIDGDLVEEAIEAILKSDPSGRLSKGDTSEQVRDAILILFRQVQLAWATDDHSELTRIAPDMQPVFAITDISGELILQLGTELEKRVRSIVSPDFDWRVRDSFRRLFDFIALTCELGSQSEAIKSRVKSRLSATHPGYDSGREYNARMIDNFIDQLLMASARIDLPNGSDAISFVVTQCSRNVAQNRIDGEILETILTGIIQECDQRSENWWFSSAMETLRSLEDSLIASSYFIRHRKDISAAGLKACDASTLSDKHKSALKRLSEELLDNASMFLLPEVPAQSIDWLMDFSMKVNRLGAGHNVVSLLLGGMSEEIYRSIPGKHTDAIVPAFSTIAGYLSISCTISDHTDEIITTTVNELAHENPAWSASQSCSKNDLAKDIDFLLTSIIIEPIRGSERKSIGCFTAFAESHLASPLNHSIWNKVVAKCEINLFKYLDYEAIRVIEPGLRRVTLLIDNFCLLREKEPEILLKLGIASGDESELLIGRGLIRTMCANASNRSDLVEERLGRNLAQMALHDESLATTIERYFSLLPKEIKSQLGRGVAIPAQRVLTRVEAIYQASMVILSQRTELAERVIASSGSRDPKLVSETAIIMHIERSIDSILEAAASLPLAAGQVLFSESLRSVLDRLLGQGLSPTNVSCFIGAFQSESAKVYPGASSEIVSAVFKNASLRTLSIATLQSKRRQLVSKAVLDCSQIAPNSSLEKLFVNSIDYLLLSGIVDPRELTLKNVYSAAQEVGQQSPDKTNSEVIASSFEASLALHLAGNEFKWMSSNLGMLCDFIRVSICSSAVSGSYLESLVARTMATSSGLIDSVEHQQQHRQVVDDTRRVLRNCLENGAPCGDEEWKQELKRINGALKHKSIIGTALAETLSQLGSVIGREFPDKANMKLSQDLHKSSKSIAV